MVWSEEQSYALPSQSLSVQHLYPLELTCDMAVGTAPAALNPTVQGFRPCRNAAVAAGARIQELAQMDDEN